MKLLFILIVSIHFFESHAQQLKNAVLYTYKNYYETSKSIKRPFLKLEEGEYKINKLWLLPSGVLLYVYQNTISIQLQNSCSYGISCSEYTKKMTEKYGLIKGILVGFNQFSNCIPLNHVNYEEYRIIELNKISNKIILY